MNNEKENVLGIDSALLKQRAAGVHKHLPMFSPTMVDWSFTSVSQVEGFVQAMQQPYSRKSSA